MRSARVLSLVIALSLATLSPPAIASADTEPERARAEQQLRAVLADIETISQQLEDRRGEQTREQARLRQLDLALQQASLRKRELVAEQTSHRAELEVLEQQRNTYVDSLDSRVGQLAEQVRSAYRERRQSPMQIILNQDDPGQVSRMLAYYEYINRAQVEKIAGLRQTIATLEEMEASIAEEMQLIESLAQQQVTLLEQLDGQRQQRVAILASLAQQIDSDRAQLEELQGNRRDLQTLIERLADILADIPVNLDQQAGIAGQKGRLPMPLDGPVRHAYGQARGAGLNWQGWLISAAAGSEASAVAYGRVAFADWLRGYGLLLIIDHGQGYMSLYGNNESLLQDVGSWVQPGESISVVGTNPGNEQGLYFELRRNGKAVDPAAWIRRR